jgi:hypothetical protein
MARNLTIALAVALTTACVFHGTPAPETDPNVITRDEIEAAGAVSIWDVITKYHAEYLRDRGKTSIRNSVAHDVAQVFLNEVVYGAIQTMQDIPARDIEEVHYYPGTVALIRFGRAYGGGVIQLKSRVQ